jgi:hypothetical protein
MRYGDLERRLARFRQGPATIRTLRDYVVWLANREEGEERPPMDPELEAMLSNFAAGAERDDS